MAPCQACPDKGEHAESGQPPEKRPCAPDCSRGRDQAGISGFAHAVGECTEQPIQAEDDPREVAAAGDPEPEIPDGEEQQSDAEHAGLRQPIGQQAGGGSSRLRRRRCNPRRRGLPRLRRSRLVQSGNNKASGKLTRLNTARTATTRQYDGLSSLSRGTQVPGWARS